MDIFHYLLVNTGEPLFLLHHMAVISMVAAVVSTGAGGMLPLTVTSLVELPSPVQMVWSYARDGRRRFPALGGIYAAISPWFTLLYVLARVVRVLCRARASVGVRVPALRVRAPAQRKLRPTARASSAHPGTMLTRQCVHAHASARSLARVRSRARPCPARHPLARRPSWRGRTRTSPQVGGGIFLIYVIFYLWSGQVAACDSQTGLLGAGTKGLHTFLCCGGFLGSSTWARTLVAGYFKFRARQAGAKSGTSKAD